MASDHFLHHLPHFHPVTALGGHAQNLPGHADLARPDMFRAASSEVSVTSLIETGTTAANLSPEMTGQYQSLIEGHGASLSPG